MLTATAMGLTSSGCVLQTSEKKSTEPSPIPSPIPSPSPSPSPSPLPTWSHTVQDGAPSTAVTLGSATAVDAAGNIFVTGNTTGPLDGQNLHGTRDFFLTKYDPSGARQWTVQDGGDPSSSTSGNGVAVDSAGNSYVTGYTTASLDGQPVHAATGGGWDLFITKYDPSGARLWTVQNGGPLGTFTNALCITIDSAGRVYAGGFTSAGLDGQRNRGLYAYFLTQYDGAGVRQWTIEDSVAGKTPFARGLATDPAGYVYVTGNTNGGLDGQSQHANLGGYDVFLHKYSFTGALQWAFQDGGTGSTDTEGYGVVNDTFGNVYVTGITSAGLDGNSRQGSHDYFLIKLNNGGGRQWTVQDGAAGTLVGGTAIAADDLGRVYVTGVSGASLDGQPLNGTQDLFVTQYDLGGSRHWTVQNGIFGASARGNGIALDGAGHLFVTGYATGALDGQSLHGTMDFVLSRYSLAGARN